MFFKTRIRQGRPSLAALALAAFALALASSVPAQELFAGEASGARAVTAPTYDAYTRTVTIHATSGDDTERLLAAFNVCTASRVGCTVRFTPGVYTVRGLDLVDFKGMLAVVGTDLRLKGLFTSVAPLRYRSAYLHSDLGGRMPAPVGITMN